MKNIINGYIYSSPILFWILLKVMPTAIIIPNYDLLSFLLPTIISIGIAIAIPLLILIIRNDSYIKGFILIFAYSLLPILSEFTEPSGGYALLSGIGLFIILILSYSILFGIFKLVYKYKNKQVI